VEWVLSIIETNTEVQIMAYQVTVSNRGDKAPFHAASYFAGSPLVAMDMAIDAINENGDYYDNVDVNNLDAYTFLTHQVIEIGTKVEGRWGAMIPTSEGTIIAVTETSVEIEWAKDDEDLLNQVLGNDTVEKDHLREEGYRSANGSPIGIYLI
jgi:hypothetical protein